MNRTRPPAGAPPLTSRRPGAWYAAGGAVLLLVAAPLGARWYLGRQAARQLIVPAAAGPASPASAGLPYAEVRLPSGDHTIRAWWVRAPSADSTQSAVLLFHANRSSLSAQVGLLEVLYRAGISALAFDYSGFGTSGGRATPAQLRQDARAAYRAFADSSRGFRRRVLLGTSLGAAVLLDAIDDLQPGVEGIVLVGCFTSAKELGRQSGRVPGWLAWLLPDLYDNLRAIGRLRRPLLLVHSAADQLFPWAGAERLLAAAPVPKRLVRLERTPHAGYLATPEGWPEVLGFIRRGLP